MARSIVGLAMIIVVAFGLALGATVTTSHVSHSHHQLADDTGPTTNLTPRSTTVTS